MAHAGAARVPRERPGVRPRGARAVAVGPHRARPRGRVLARGLGRLRPLRHPGAPGAGRPRRAGGGRAHDRGRARGPRLRLRGRRPAVLDQRPPVVGRRAGVEARHARAAAAVAARPLRRLADRHPRRHRTRRRFRRVRHDLARRGRRRRLADHRSQDLHLERAGRRPAHHVRAHDAGDRARPGSPRSCWSAGAEGRRCRATSRRWACAPRRWARSCSRVCAPAPATCWAPSGAGRACSRPRWTGSAASSCRRRSGAMQRITERTIRYARERRQFGQPIGRFESVCGQDRRHGGAAARLARDAVPRRARDGRRRRSHRDERAGEGLHLRGIGGHPSGTRCRSTAATAT